MYRFIEQFTASNHYFFRNAYIKKVCVCIYNIVFLCVINTVAAQTMVPSYQERDQAARYLIKKTKDQFNEQGSDLVTYKIADKEAFYAYYSYLAKVYRDDFQIYLEMERKNLNTYLSNAQELVSKAEHCLTHEEMNLFDHFVFFFKKGPIRFIEEGLGLNKACHTNFSDDSIRELKNELIRSSRRARNIDSKLEDYVHSNTDGIDVNDLNSFQHSIDFDLEVNHSLLAIIDKYHDVFKTSSQTINYMDNFFDKIAQADEQNNRPIYEQMKKLGAYIEKSPYIDAYIIYALEIDMLEHWRAEVEKPTKKDRIPYSNSEWYYSLVNSVKRKEHAIMSAVEVDIQRSFKNKLQKFFDPFLIKTDFHKSSASQYIKDIWLTIEETSEYIRDKWYVVPHNREFHLTNIFKVTNDTTGYHRASYDIFDEERPDDTYDRQKDDLLEIDKIYDVCYDAIVIEKINDSDSSDKQYFFDIVRKSSFVFKIINAEAQATIKYDLKDQSGNILQTDTFSLDMEGTAEVKNLVTLSPGRYELSFSSQRMSNYLVLIRVPDNRIGDKFYPFKETGLGHQKLNKDGKKHATGKDMHHLPEWSGFIGLFKERRDFWAKPRHSVQPFIWGKKYR